MGLGVLESKTLDHVPGTTRYYNDPSQPQPANGANRGLKVDDSGPVPIILVPPLIPWTSIALADECDNRSPSPLTTRTIL
ncbi:hypothetical protein VDGD_21576 [Verticillium dahliae]|nr:hypothetical protein VDGD_21576 [Verticillium dahliae]